jgi:hypothetical protein
MKCEAEGCDRKAVWICRGIGMDRKFLTPIVTCDHHIKHVRFEKHAIVTVRRLHEQGDEPASLESPMPQSKPKRRRSAEVPRCLCGCKRAARWPHDGAPLFYARLCAYEMMVAQVRAEKAGGGA